MQHNTQTAPSLNGPLNAALANVSAQLADRLLLLVSAVQPSLSYSTLALNGSAAAKACVFQCGSGKKYSKNIKYVLVGGSKVNSSFWKRVSAAPTASRL